MEANADMVTAWLDDVKAIVSELDSKLAEAKDLEVEINYSADKEDKHAKKDKVKIFFNNFGAPELVINGRHMLVVTLDYSYVTWTQEYEGTNLMRATGYFEGEEELVTIAFDKSANEIYKMS